MARKSLSFLLLALYAASGGHGSPIEQQPLNDPQSGATVIKELIKAEIIPTVVYPFIPLLSINITWPTNKTAALGNTIAPDDVQKKPSVIIESIGTKSTKLTTIAITLTDPDAPSRDNPEWSEMCHWIAAIEPPSSSSLAREEVEMKSPHMKDVMPYKPPGPPPKTGKHRYVFLAFAPANGTSEKLYLSKPDDRQHWGTGKERHGVRDWARDNGLIPVGANFIYAQNDKQ